MNFMSFCCGTTIDDTASISERPLMRNAVNNAPTRSPTKSSSVRRTKRSFSLAIDHLNPFATPVQCTVSAKAPYPSRKDLVNSFVDYDEELPASAKNRHLQFRQGDAICVLGQYNDMLIGYLENDSQKTLGFFAPHLVYVDLASINQIEPPSKLTSIITNPQAAYSSRVMNTLPPIASR
ncbi:hypothetical protein DSO57_1004160 [Entomophthora muscae]|uniref:Uncharacterized protein n=2 Tax=Entomophthora muscae TaxID=34485 RepID=A0ACC2UHP8_9FUNG|nr:hypothetical protein DSO57_1034584 [Entomophthora muscae]KAJ9086437.1 hypothetical protein DSO57_1004160 [Entomophthora muscae]